MRKGIDCRENDWEEILLYGKMIDITNQRFHKLTALFPVKSNGRIKWLCECKCGNLIAVQPANLKNGNTQSCGCLQANKTTERWIKYREDAQIIGKKFSRLSVLEFVGIENKEAMYKYSCDCGNSIIRSHHSVGSGNTSSCGCLLNELRDRTKYDIIGQRFGKLTVVSYAGMNKYGGTDFECLCDCGNTTIVSRNSLVEDAVKTCGCVRSIGESNIKDILDSANILYEAQYSFADLISEAGGYPLYDFAILDEAHEMKM